MRKLASIQIIHDVEPIENADAIELVHVLGWQCVAKKGEFKKGDECVYFEIDSFLPIRPEFEFLRSSSYKNSDMLGEGFRLRTQKMRGALSQGLVLRKEEFPELADRKVGDDVSDVLGVRKWEIEEKATTGGTIIGTLPSFIPHTDETRIQSEPDVLKEFDGLSYYITTKMDGSSHSIALDEDDNFYVTGHNYVYKDDGKSSFYEYVKEKGFEEKLRELKRDLGLNTIVVQGEFCAPGIQNNRLRLKKPDWYVFTVIANGERARPTTTFRIAKTIGASEVPTEEIEDCLTLRYPTVEDLLKRAEGEYPNGGQKEGIVVRPLEPVWSEVLNAPLSFKVINNKYLLKNS